MNRKAQKLISLSQGNTHNSVTELPLPQLKCFSYKTCSLSFDRRRCYRQSESHRSPAGCHRSGRTERCVSSAAVGFRSGALPPGATSREGAGWALHSSSSAATGRYLPGRSVSFPAAYPHDKPPLPDGQLLHGFLPLIDID